MHRGPVLIVVVVVLVLAGGCLDVTGTQAGPATAEQSPASSPATDDSRLDGTLTVHYLDVGQADATVLAFPNGETMLIDSGDWRQDGEEVLGFLESRGIERLDHLVATHPHADHIGGHEAVIEYFETAGAGIGTAYDSGVAHTSGTFEGYLDAVERHDVDLVTVEAGDELAVGDATVRFLNPPPGRHSDEIHPNGVSLVVDYGDSEFLFTGDLEGAGERRLVANGSIGLAADVYQAGHHGSRTSSSPAFLDAVDPSVVVISSALDSQYGHPHDETLDAFTDRDAETYWTAVHGDVTVRSDGTSLAVTTERDAPTDPDALRRLKDEVSPVPHRHPPGFVAGAPTVGIP